MCNGSVLTADELAAHEIAAALHEYLIDKYGDYPYRVWFMGIEKLSASLNRSNRLPPRSINEQST